jgi:hypothetical protein
MKPLPLTPAGTNVPANSETPLAVILAGDREAADLSSRSVKLFQEIQFPMAEMELAVTLEAVHARAETITPLLEEILRSRPPAHWGINE